MAIDISEAEFEGECDIRDIPARLIKIDPATQCRVMRENAAEADLERIDFMNTYFKTSIRFMLDSNNDGLVLAAAKRNMKKFSNEMKVIENLKKAGIAE
jgi:hypothetical protein